MGRIKLALPGIEKKRIGSTAPPTIAILRKAEDSSAFFPMPSIPIVKIDGNKIELEKPINAKAQSIVLLSPNKI